MELGASIQNKVLPNEFQRDDGANVIQSLNVFTKSQNKFTSPDNVIEKNVIGLSIEPLKEKNESSQRTDQ